MSTSHLYAGREQTLVKHFILRKYLERFAHIVGTRWDTLTYVDCFSGPWNVKSEDFQDSSFAIALEQLRKARATHRVKGRTLRLRCFFLESDPAAYAKLRQFTDQITDAEIGLQNKKLEDAIPAIVDFVKNGGQQSFPFIFIDPTGWTGFEMATIAPLLGLDPGEVLINFMTGHIRRFIESPQDQTQESFVKLFGSQSFKADIEGLSKRDREDAVVAAYCQNVRKTGAFQYVCSAMVLHPERARTHFHLIYATRDPKGVEVFKAVEKQAMAIMEKVRAEARQRRREEKTGQTELYGGEVLHDPTYYNSLRKRYIAKSKESVLGLLQTKVRVPYDEVWALVQTTPMSWESDLKEWVRAWVKGQHLEIQGLRARQHVPQRGQNIHLIWKESAKPKTDSHE